MPQRIEHPTHTDIHLDVRSQIRQLWQALRALNREVVFSYPGVLFVSTSPPWTPRQNGTLVEVRCLLGTAGTATSVITAYKNGSSIGTVTMTSGQTNVSAAFSTPFVANTDILTVGVTTAGATAALLTVIARF